MCLQRTRVYASVFLTLFHLFLKNNSRIYILLSLLYRGGTRREERAQWSEGLCELQEVQIAEIPSASKVYVSLSTLPQEHRYSKREKYN